MKAEKPAEGILIRKDYGDTKLYKVSCDCGCADHDHNVWVEADLDGVTVTTYTQLKTKFWELSRWSMMWTLLTKGYVECEGSTIMSEQQALTYAETLKSAIKDVSEFKKNGNKKS